MHSCHKVLLAEHFRNKEKEEIDMEMIKWLDESYHLK
jgi:hypothetical protein